MKLLTIGHLVIAILVFATLPAFANSSYDFTVNTSSINGQSGYIDLEFNPGASCTGMGSAVVTNWISDATLGAVTTTGDVSGLLPSAVTMTDTSQFNDYNEALTFGNTIYFDLNLNGCSGESFSLSFLQSDDQTPLLTTDSLDGYALTADMNSESTLINVSSPDIVVHTDSVPEPRTLPLLLSAFCLAGLSGITKKVHCSVS